MEKKSLFFIFEKNKYELNKKCDSINDVINFFFSIISCNISDLYFILNGKKINLDKIIKLKDFYLPNKNYIIIYVFNIANKKNRIKQNKNKNIICPKCKNPAIINFDKKTISINDCINGHKISDLTFYEFSDSQNIDEAEIKCNICENSKFLYDYNFYKCSCGLNICPLCIYKHKEHKKIFYDSNYFQCYKHGISFVSYCETCKRNLCNSCESDIIHSNHQIILFKQRELKQNTINKIINDMEELNNKILQFKLEISKLETLFGEIFKYLNNYYDVYIKMNDKILNCCKKLDNFESIINIENYNKKINSILKEINNFFLLDLKHKLQYIVDTYNKIPNNELTIIYNNNDKNIKLFGKKFVETNKDNCYLIIDEKIFNLMENYNFNQSNKEVDIKIKLIEKQLISDFSFMFEDCKSLYSIINAQRFNTSIVNNMSHIFYNCSSLTLLEGIDKWNTFNVKDMNNMFYNCSLLESIPDISNWNTNKVKNMSYMFYGCESLSSLPDISKWNVSNVTNISYMFANCKSLSFLPNISEWSMINIKDISYLCFNCSSLLFVPDILKWVNNISNIDCAFSYCSSLRYFPDITKYIILSKRDLDQLFSISKLSLDSNNNTNIIASASENSNKSKNEDNNKEKYILYNSESIMHKKIERYKINERENNKLMQIFTKYINTENDFITKDNLQQILDLSDPELFNIIFLLFKENYQEMEILKFKDIKDIYYSFLSNDPFVKINLISFLIFKTDEIIKQKEIIIKNIKFFQKSELFDILIKINSTFEQSVYDKLSNANIKEISITRNDFVKLCKKEESFFNNFRFINKVFIGSSKYNPLKNNNLNIICDCDYTKENNIKDYLDSMKRGYDYLTSATKGIFYLTDFIKALKNENINRKMIKIIIGYLNKYTLKDYCRFNDIKYIFSNLNYSVSLTDKKRFLFKMIVTICGKDNKLTDKQINEFLDFDSPVNTLNEKNENNIDKNNQKNDDINTNSEENLNEIKTNEDGEIITDNNNLIEQNSNTNDNVDETNTDMKNSKEINNGNEKRILDENNTENNLKLYGEEEFMNDFDDKFIKIISHLDNFGLLPYKLFRAQTKDKKTKRRLIKNILKNISIDNHEIYLKESFDYCNIFYIVDINFWNSLMNEQEEIPDYINNPRIAEEIIIIKEEDKFYQEENNERMREFEEKERKEMEKREKNKEKKPKEEKGDKNKENKETKDEKKEEETGLNIIENMVTKNGKLKKGLKYKKDFIILCDELYNIIKNNFKFDYEIKLKKIKTIYLITNKKNEEEQSKQNDIKKEEGKNDEMKKEDIKE